MNIKELFKIYKEISQNIILALENNNLDLVDEFLSERQEILKDILLQGSKEELQKQYEEYDLFNIDGIMKDKFEYKIDDLKKEMAHLRKRKEASKSYNNLNAKAVYLSKEI